MTCRECGMPTTNRRYCKTCLQGRDRKGRYPEDRFEDYECPTCGQDTAMAEGRDCWMCRSDRYELVDGEHKRVDESNIDDLFGGGVA